MSRIKWSRPVLLAVVVTAASMLGFAQQASAHGPCAIWWGRPLLWAGCVVRHVLCPHHLPYYACPVCGGCPAWCDPCWDPCWAPCCDPCCGVVLGEAPVVPVQPAPAQPTPAQPAPAQPAPAQPPADQASPAGDQARASFGQAELEVAVPASARVLVNDRPTTSVGELRRYVAKQLEPGKRYTFRVRAEWEQDGQVVRETKVVRLEANQKARLQFALAEAPPTRTVLTLHVPEDAQVWLAGHATEASGRLRRYATTQLAPGEQWPEYEIRVALRRNGQTLTQRRTITLTGGQAMELRFDFDRSLAAAD